MKRLVLMLALLILLAACGKEEIAEPLVVVVPPPVPEPMPPPEPIVIEPMPQPEPIPEVEIKEPEPAPVPVIPGRPSCKILKDQGLVYTLEDIAQGKISMADYDNLRICYPYFGPNQADTESKCCII